jgi:hypothetical protein
MERLSGQVLTITVQACRTINEPGILASPIDFPAIGLDPKTYGFLTFQVLCLQLINKMCWLRKRGLFCG